MMPAKRVWIGLTLLLILFGVGVVSGREIRQGDQCVVETNETITGNLFVLCRTLIVQGRVEGNLIGGALTAEIYGAVEGDVYLIAGELDTGASLGKDLHFAGPVLRVHPETRFADEQGGDLMSVSLSTAILEGAHIPGTIIDLGYQLVIHGTVGNEVSFWGSALTVDGLVEGDIDAAVGDPSTNVSQLGTVLGQLNVEVVNPGLHVTERGAINGRLSYTGPVEGDITGVLASEPVFTRVVVLSEIIQQDTPRVVNIYVSDVVREFLTLSIVGGLGLLFAPRSLQAPIRNLQARPLPSLSLGLITFILSFPIWAIVLFISAVLVILLLLLRLEGFVIAVSVVLGLIFAVGASLFYFIAIYVTRVIVALALGRALMRFALGEHTYPRVAYLNLVAGVVVMAVFSSLPLIGWLVHAVAAFAGLGALLLILRGQLRTVRDTAPPSPAWLPRRDVLPQIPPPMIGDATRPPGMDNLPAGFSWWKDDD